MGLACSKCIYFLRINVPHLIYLRNNSCLFNENIFHILMLDAINCRLRAFRLYIYIFPYNGSMQGLRMHATPWHTGKNYYFPHASHKWNNRRKCPQCTSRLHNMQQIPFIDWCLTLVFSFTSS